MKILMLGVYDLKVYMRARVIYEGLKKNKVDVELLTSQSKTKYFKIVKRLLKRDYDAVIVTGKIVYFLAKLLAKKTIIFDLFISDYDTMVNNRKLVSKYSPMAWIYLWIDKISCRTSKCTLLDTENHIEYLSELIGFNKKNFKRVVVGGDDTIFYPRDIKRKDKKFKVLFYGSFIPGHGIKHILRAAKMLERYEDIEFEILGAGQTFPEIKAFSEKLNNRNVNFRGWVDYTKIPDYIASSDVALGLFGGKVKKVNLVIGNKIYEILAMRQALITGDCPGIREELKHQETAILCKMSDAKAIADSILALKKDKTLRDKIANNSYKLFKKKFSTEQIGKQVLEIVKEEIKKECIN